MAVVSGAGRVPEVTTQVSLDQRVQHGLVASCVTTHFFPQALTDPGDDLNPFRRTCCSFSVVTSSVDRIEHPVQAERAFDLLRKKFTYRAALASTRQEALAARSTARRTSV
jgi:hypothetical protein